MVMPKFKWAEECLQGSLFGQLGGGRNGVGDVPFGVKHTTIYKAP